MEDGGWRMEDGGWRMVGGILRVVNRGRALKAIKNYLTIIF
jgi:hypothetical protein